MVSMIFKILLILSLLSVQTFAWTLELGGKVASGDDTNQGCTQRNAAQGTRVSWDRGFFEDCCVRLYSDSSCLADVEIGFFCDDTEKSLSQNVVAFQVTNC